MSFSPHYSLDSFDHGYRADALALYTSITGAVLDDNTGLLKLSAAQFANLQSLFFVINGVTFEFTANAQIWPVRSSCLSH